MDSFREKARHLKQPYYIINAWAALSWLWLRTVVPGAELVCVPGSGAYLFETKEREVYMLVGLALLGKLRRANSLHECMTKIFWYGKLAVGMCLLHCDVIVIFALACAVGALIHLIPPPTFLGSEKVTVLDDQTFPKFALCKTEPMKIVELTCSWHDGADALKPLFCGLAADYAGSKRLFGSIDVARYPEIAKRYDVDLGVRSLQLPSYLLFRDGVLCRRLPYFDRNDATKVVRTRFTRQSMESFFLLNVKASEAARRLEKIEKNRGSEPAPAAVEKPAERSSWNPFRRRR